MNKEEYDKYKKVVDELDGYDICDEFNLGTYELKDKKKLLEIVLMYYFKNQDELQEKDQEIDRLNNIIDELEKALNAEVKLRYRGKDTGLYTKLFNEGGQLYREYIMVKLKELKGGK